MERPGNRLLVGTATVNINMKVLPIIFMRSKPLVQTSSPMKYTGEGASYALLSSFVCIMLLLILIAACSHGGGCQNIQIHPLQKLTPYSVDIARNLLPRSKIWQGIAQLNHHMTIRSDRQGTHGANGRSGNEGGANTILSSVRLVVSWTHHHRHSALPSHHPRQHPSYYSNNVNSLPCYLAYETNSNAPALLKSLHPRG